MKINTLDNKKVFFFYLILVDFIVAIQIAAVSFFPKNPADFILSFFASFLIFLIFSEIFENNGKIKSVIQPGLVFMILGSLANFFMVDSNLFVFGRTFSGLGAGMIMAGQIGIIWHGDFEKMKNFSLAIVASFILGLVFGPALIGFLSGPSLKEIRIVFLLGVVFPGLLMLEFNQLSERLMKFLIREKKRLGILGVGYLVNESIDFVFNYIIYPFAIWKLGILGGGAVMTIASFLVCYAIMIFYDWAKKDWLGIETLKQLKEYNGKSLIGKFTSWIMQKSDPVLLLFLSIQFDPFITTAYMRSGAHKYSGMSKRDWIIFMSSLIIGNAYWTIVAFAGVSVIEFFGKYLF
ncbi:MAG TPA: MFS transporter [Candidatus Moranbacteria bacterium]|nr:MFS transporter [Candidatus Moranbacteria bacterium]